VSKLPTGWVQIALGDALQIQKGKKPIDLGPKRENRPVPYINISAFETKQVQEYAPEQDIPRCEPSDTLLVWDGARAGLAGRGIGGFIGSTLARLTSDLSDPSYLYYFIHSNYGYLNTHTKGVGIPHIDPIVLAEISYPLPPIAEQTRIVAKLEELLSDLDAGVAELKAAQKKLGQYRQSLLKAAVGGALTAEWRAKHKPTETGAQLLERILTERRARWEAKQLAKFKEQGKTPPKDWQKKYPEPGQPDTTNLPQLPQGWVWASVGQLLSELTSGSRDWAPYYDRGSCVFVMAQNVRPWRPDFSFKQYVDPPLNHRDRARSEIRADDLLTTIVGANTGQVCRVPEGLVSHFVCQSVALIRLVMPSMSEFVNAVLNSEGHGQRQFREMNYGAGRPHLSFDQLESVLVPLPPMSEQAEVVRVLADALQQCEQVEAEVDRLFKQSFAQRQNILRAAFAGELVPQDPNDEPASVLLDRIRAERAAQGAVKKPRGRKKKGAV
jgi:type I restriction enzyme S subunit